MERRIYLGKGVIILVVLVTAGLVAIGWMGTPFFRTWHNEHRTPSSQGGSSGFHRDKNFQNIEFLVWKTGAGHIYYAISIGYDDFDPNIPTIGYKYSWNMDNGGNLEVNGRRIDFSPDCPLLALDPFGEMVEITLTEIEAEILKRHNGDRVWTEVVLPRLYSIKGEERDGK